MDVGESSSFPFCFFCAIFFSTLDEERVGSSMEGIILATSPVCNCNVCLLVFAVGVHKRVEFSQLFYQCFISALTFFLRKYEALTFCPQAKR